MNLKQAKRLRASLGSWRPAEEQRRDYQRVKLRMKRDGIVILRNPEGHPNHGGGVTTRSLLNGR